MTSGIARGEAHPRMVTSQPNRVLYAVVQTGKFRLRKGDDLVMPKYANTKLASNHLNSFFTLCVRGSTSVVRIKN